MFHRRAILGEAILTVCLDYAGKTMNVFLSNFPESINHSHEN
jgi:hypothetical protein